MQRKSGEGRQEREKESNLEREVRGNERARESIGKEGKKREERGR